MSTTLEIDCMECIAHAADTGHPQDSEFGTVVENVTHYVAKSGRGSWYRLCDYEINGRLREGRRYLPARHVKLVEGP